MKRNATWLEKLFFFLESLMAATRDAVLGVYEQLVSLVCKKNRRGRTILAWSIFAIFTAVLIRIGCLGVSFPMGKVALCLGAILAGTELSFLLMRLGNRGWVRNVIFCVIFFIGVAAYLKLPPYGTGPWKVLLACCNSLGSFFPSRGSFDSVGGKPVCSPLYVTFHILVYVFFAYFALSLWGARAYNRVMNFWTRDRNKCVFWCETIGDNDSVSEKMFLLAESMKAREVNWRMVFSVSEEKSLGRDYFLFREMNYMGYVLKLRKPRQIHTDCLRAKRHFFLTGDFNWNIRQAEALLREREERKVSSPVDLYVMISDSSEENDYYSSWADHIHAKSALNPEKYGRVEIHLVNESELIARKFIEAYPMLKCPGIEIDTKTATVMGKFRVLLLGLGNHGEALLRNMIEDGQFVHSSRRIFASSLRRTLACPFRRTFTCPFRRTFTCPLRRTLACPFRLTFTWQLRRAGDTPDFKVDVFDSSPGRLEYFFKRYPDANRYCRMDLGPGNPAGGRGASPASGPCPPVTPEHLARYRCDVFSAEFLDFLTEHIGDYNRIVICLGDDQLNIRAAACLERIAKLKSTLPKGFLEGRLFVLLEENNALFKELKKNDKSVAECLEGSGVPGKMQMTVFGSPDEIFTYDDIAEQDAIVDMGKLVNSTWLLKEGEDLEKLKHKRPLGWEVGENGGIVSYFNRQSSIASAKGFRNIILLLTDLSAAEAAKFVPDPQKDPRWKWLEEVKKTDDASQDVSKEQWELLENIAQTEHLRWNAFHFMRGIRCWTLDEIDKDIKAGKSIGRPNDIEKHARHAALVPYSKLCEVNECFGLEKEKAMEYNDRKIVETLMKVRRGWKKLFEDEKDWPIRATHHNNPADPRNRPL